MSDDKPTKMNPYEVLAVPNDADEKAIARAYRKLALQHHPDRNPDGADLFKTIASAYAVLSDTAKRGMYDATGSLGEHGCPGADDDELGTGGGAGGAGGVARNYEEFSKQLDEFYASYVGSEEEKEDAVTAFVKVDGSFIKLVKELLLFQNEEGIIERLHGLIGALIDEGRLESTAKWVETTTAKKLRALKNHLKEERGLAEVEIEKEKAGGRGGDNENTTTVATKMAMPLIDIKAREKEYSSMLDGLLAKYGGEEPKRGPKKKGGKKRAADRGEDEDEEAAPKKKKKRSCA